MKPADEQPLPWGAHAPARATRSLQWMIRLGLARGTMAKTIHRLWLARHGPVVDTTVRGLRYRLDISDNTTDGKILISSKVYDQIELDHLVRHGGEGVFVDIGANIGYYSLSLAHAGCERVIAIEPNPPALERLRYNIGLNQLGERIEVVAAGVGPDAELEFYQTGGLGGSGFVKPVHDAPVIKVRSIPLMQILADRQVERIGGLKIDVEGFEDQVLFPFLREAPEALLPACIVMESCHRHEWESDLLPAFHARGYRLACETRANRIFIKEGKSPSAAAA
jgi:FkbM family methyltransferase